MGVRVTELGYFGNVYVRQLAFDRAGDVYPGHQHHFDHTSKIVRGSFLLQWRDPDGQTGESLHSVAEHEGRMEIKADRWHQLTALEDDSESWCLFAVRDEAGAVVRDVQDADPHHAYRN